MFLNDLKYSLEKIDHYKDELLFLFIKPHWPRKISPNQITYVRIVIGVILFVLLFFFNIENKPIIISLFCFGALTDLLDGPIARGLNKVTEFGAMLDPIADRILILPMAIYSLYRFNRWLLLSLLLTEIIYALVAVFYKSKTTYREPNIFAKTKTFLLAIVFIAILLVWPSSPPVFFIDVLWISLLFAYLSILTMLLDLKNKGHIENKIIKKQLDNYENL